MAPTQLQNKTAALGRLIKDEKYYQQEIADQENKVEKLKQSGGDEYELKMAVRVLDDTKQMIPEIRNKIKTYLDSLKSLLESDLDEDTTDAKKRVEEAEEFLKS